MWNLGGGPGAEVSLKDFRKDIVIEVYNEAGQLVLAYKVFRCWVSEYQALPDLDANSDAVMLEHIRLENEGWERDTSVVAPPEPSFGKGQRMMSVLTLRSPAARWTTTLGLVSVVALLLGATLLIALETPSKPFLDKNSFYLSSAGFRVQLANDAAGKKALRALPPHRFVTHSIAGQTRYFYAEPQHCSCVFVGTQAAYDSYRNMLNQQLPQADNVSPDYRNQATTLLNSTPVGLQTLQDPGYLQEYFRSYY